MLDLEGRGAPEVTVDLHDATGTFLDSADTDRDGTADAGCPTAMDALAAGRDGMLYAASDGDAATAGIWRIWADAPGPREVSPPGSP